MSKANQRRAISEKFDIINAPAHYVAGRQYETFPVIVSLRLSRHHCLANAIKYLSRRTRKGEEKENLQKALWYLKHCEQEKSTDYNYEKVAEDWDLDESLTKSFLSIVLAASSYQDNISVEKAICYIEERLKAAEEEFIQALMQKLAPEKD